MRQHTFSKRIISVFLALTVLLSMMSSLTLTVGASSVTTTAGNQKITDESTLNHWSDLFKDNDTTNAGAIWTDKSVFTDTQAYLNATLEQEDATTVFAPLDVDRDSNNFLVALSAMAATKSVSGTASVPTDSLLVLDLSNSMENSGSDDDLAIAANATIGELLDMNPANRVGVVLYSGNSTEGNASAGTATVLLPLDRYTTDKIGENGEKVYIEHSGDGIRIAQTTTGFWLWATTTVNVKDSKGNTLDSKSKSFDGATYIQNGIYQAAKAMIADGNTGLLNDTQHKPVVVLMSDGAPTVATTNFSEVGTSNIGNGTSTNNNIVFLSQLTAAYAKKMIKDAYGVDPLLYTLGLGVGSDNNAVSVLDPSKSNATVNGYWTSYNQLAAGGTMTLGNRSVTSVGPLTQLYADKYIEAGTAEKLVEAFKTIVSNIELQSKYYPTLVDDGDVHHSGYVYFHDVIGKGMDIVEIEGIQEGNHLYTGAAIAKAIQNGEMGTRENPTAFGNTLVASVRERLGIENVDVARALLADAFANGQLYYRNDDDFGNRIGWYADADNRFISFWDGKYLPGETDDSGNVVTAPTGAVSANMSYLFMGTLHEGTDPTNLLYASVQVQHFFNDDRVMLVGKLPASLIPTKEYKVTLDENDVATIEEAGDAYPARLLYEVGLSESVDLLDAAAMSAHLDNGKYVFYTNDWESTVGIPAQQNNTYSLFHPSLENDRYYYSGGVPLYANANGTPLTTAPVSGGTYYRGFTVYKDGQVPTVVYEPISEAAIAAAARGNDGHYYVVGDVIHQYVAPAFYEQKTNNETDTFAYSDYPFVHADHDPAHCTNVLGNNGKLLVEPFDGIAVTKTVDNTITDEGQVYPFTITLTGGTHAANAQFTVIVKDENGAQISESTVFFADSYTFSLGIGETAYFVGLPVGNTYEITETASTNGSYELIAVNGNAANKATVTVTENQIVPAVFTNSKIPVGSVAITKTVLSSITDHLITKDFAFTVDLGTAYAGKTVQTNTGTLVLDNNGQATVHLKHEGELELLNLREGTTVTVSEINIPAGFTLQSQNDQQATVVKNQKTELNFVNSYKAAPSQRPTNVTLEGNKTVTGNWTGDGTFIFVLERHDEDPNGNEVHTELGTATVTFNNGVAVNNGFFTLTTLIQDETYNTVGAYSYRVREKVESMTTVNGMANDLRAYHFDVIVSDDGNGQLYISDVVAGDNHIRVTGSDTDNDNVEDHWLVNDVNFVNHYSLDDQAELLISLKKTLTGSSGVNLPLSNFRFELYETDNTFVIPSGAAPIRSEMANASGELDMVLNYTEDDLVNASRDEFYYVLKEVDNGIPAVDYDTTEYHLIVTLLDDGHGNLDIRVREQNDTADTLPADPTASVQVVKYEATFTNDYAPKSVTVDTIGGKKTIRDNKRPFLTANEFTFGLYEITVDGSGNLVIDSTPIRTKGNDLNGNFVFDGITYSKVGVYNYLIREEVGTLAGMTYDKTTFHAVVTVTGNQTTGELEAAVSYADAQGNAITAGAVRFENVYTPKTTTASIPVYKTLQSKINKMLAADDFAFELWREDGATDTLMGVIGNGAGANMAEVSGGYSSTGMTTFADVEEYTEAGVYTYYVKEVIPNGATAENWYNGITYDDTVFTVKVTVVNDYANGALSVESVAVQNASRVEFLNKHEPKATQTTLSVEKTLHGGALQNGMFGFELYEAHYDAATQEQFVLGNRIDTKNTMVNGVYTFDTLHYDRAGEYRYVVKETIPATDSYNGKMVYDTTVYHVKVDVMENTRGELVAQAPILLNASIGNETDKMTFINNWLPETLDASALFSGDKQVTGREWLDDDTFTFELYLAEKNADGTVSVTNETPILSATTSKAQNGAFAFADGADTDYLSYTKAGNYYYVVSEKAPAQTNGITYDDNKFVLEIVVTEQADNSGRSVLSATRNVYLNNAKIPDTATDNALGFVNEYKPAGSVTSAPINGNKVLNDQNGNPIAIGNHSFGFALYEADAAFNVTNTTPIAKKYASALDGKFAFDGITYTAVGTHYYVIAEILPDGAQNGQKDGVTYDATKYGVTVTIGDDNKGALTAPTVNVKYLTTNQGVETVTFVNVYTAPPAEDPDKDPEKDPDKDPDNDPEKEPDKDLEDIPTVPPMGETTDFLKWIALAFVSGCILLTQTKKRKKQEE